MHDVISIQVEGMEEGDKLISYLASMEVWVTPFVVVQEGDYIVKAAIPMNQLEEALAYVRQE